MAKEKQREGLGRTDVGKQGDMPKHDEAGKQGGETGKQGGLPGEKKEWEKEKGGVGMPHEPSRTPPTGTPPPA